MIAGGYSLHLYCVNGLTSARLDATRLLHQAGGEAPPRDTCAWDDREPHRQNMGDYYAENISTAKRMARMRGWKFVDGDCVCPECVKDGRW